MVIEQLENDIIVVRPVKVDRTRSPQQVLDATGRKQYADVGATASMPCLEGDEVDVHFFKISREISCADLEKEYTLRGLTPDPYAQAAVNEANPAFADDNPNGSQWKDTDGNYTCVTFVRWGDERSVGCRCHDSEWRGRWWFAGVRK